MNKRLQKSTLKNASKYFLKHPACKKMIFSTYRPMDNSNAYSDAMINLQHVKEKKRFPTEDEYSDLIKDTLKSMNDVFIQFYEKYAAYCNTTIRELDFPNVDDIFNQFHSYLQRQRAPDCPKRKTEKAPCNYGDYRRMKEDLNPSFSSFNDPPAKRVKATEDDWDDDDMTDEPTPITSAPTTNIQATVADDWGDEDVAELTATTPATPAWNDRSKNNYHIERPTFDRGNNFRGRGERGSRGGFERGSRGGARGGFNRDRGSFNRGRGGFNHDRNDSDRYGGSFKNNNNNGWKNNAASTQGTIEDDGWGEDTTQTPIASDMSKQPVAKTNAADDDGWND